MAGGLLLLASFPKSGNTWLRLLIDRAVYGREVDINQISSASAAQRDLLDKWLGFETSELTEAQVARMRPWAYRTAARSSDQIITLKVHDSLLPLTADGPPPFTPDGIRAVFYAVRDPRDVAVSWASHMGVTIDEAITRMADPNWMASDSPDALKPQVVQRYASWSQHVASWLDASGFPLRLVRYEDLLLKPEEVLADALSFADLPADTETVRAAVHGADFSRLRDQEQAAGFPERRKASSAPFFRRGISGGWRSDLSVDQVARIEADHGEVMRRLGYL